jgi:hypothetical protein
MILFDLGCPHGHRFEGWFASAEEFARQKDAELVRCPVCDDVGVALIPTAKVRVNKARKPKARAPAPAGGEATPQPMMAGLPAEIVRKLREIVRNTEDVGGRFPEEARKIHYEEVPARAIRGQASPEDAEALAEEGIDFAPLPSFLTRDTH